MSRKSNNIKDIKTKKRYSLIPEGYEKDYEEYLREEKYKEYEIFNEKNEDFRKRIKSFSKTIEDKNNSNNKELLLSEQIDQAIKAYLKEHMHEDADVMKVLRNLKEGTISLKFMKKDGGVEFKKLNIQELLNYYKSSNGKDEIEK